MKSYRGLPVLAGVCSLEEAQRPGLSVAASVARLKRHHYALKRLHGIFTARITAEPIYELKMAFSRHAHLCAEHVAALRERVSEMREPPLGLDAVPDAALEIFYDEILAAPTTAELVLGLYEKAVPAVQRELEAHVADTNRLTDNPTVRVCRFALLELGDIAEFGRQAVGCLVDEATRRQAAGWLALLDDCLAGKTPSRQYSATPYIYDRMPHRDERFKDNYNMGVNAEVFLYDPQYPASVKVLMMYYKRLREIDVPEMMASIVTETPDKPWGYYRDMTRQIWDEARHAMMGEVGFANLQVDWPDKVMINFTWSVGLNTQLQPWERHGVLYFIEQGLMPKTGKRFEWETALAAANPLSATMQDFDWADEVLHARIGRTWYVSQFKTATDAVAYGDKCWSKVLADWRGWRDQGLTQHRNWWPDLYNAYCQQHDIAPDPKIAAYHETYETTRADLKSITGSA
ncbi:MAG: hypothetical protein WCS70_01870 [Verrucomicrobiota bacterium]